MNEQIVALDQAKSTLIDLAIRFGPKLLVALLSWPRASSWAAGWAGSPSGCW